MWTTTLWIYTLYGDHILSTGNTNDLPSVNDNGTNKLYTSLTAVRSDDPRGITSRTTINCSNAPKTMSVRHGSIMAPRTGMIQKLAQTGTRLIMTYQVSIATRSTLINMHLVNELASQPVSNQEFYTIFREKLQSLPWEKLLCDTNQCEDTILLFRNILAKYAKHISIKTCPDGKLISRKTTKIWTPAYKYALDCYSLQSFILNKDARIISETVYKRRHTCTSIKTEDNCIWANLHQL